jgi:hypothetical protein
MNSFILPLFLSLVTFFFASSKLMAQAPEGINYQAVIRTTAGNLVTNSTVAIRIQIKQNSASGTVVYAERQSVATSNFGLVNMVIGQGTVLSGTFANINWSTGNYWVSLGVDFANGTNYVDYGSQRLMSAPYALYAKTAGVQLNQWRYGTTVPAAALGAMGDFYLNTQTGDVYYKTNSTTWTLTGNIKGPQGNAGATGATGPAGPTGATGAAGPQGPAGPTGATGLTGPAGATGLTGPQGPAGPTGAAGPQGSTGINGTAVLNGSVAPSNALGVNGDFYINTTTNELFGPKANGTWPGGVSLVGPPGPAGGPAGPQGVAGTNGNSVLNGTVNPNVATGVDGDFYINTLTNEIFGPKSAGVWPQGVSLVGPSGLLGAPGPQGPAGAAGPQGVSGANGTSVLNGNVNPVGAIGMDGDFYINTATNELFGPKANGAWPQGISLVGPSGANGLPGPAGPTGPQGPQGPTGPAGGGMTVNCGTAFNSNYTIRGDGSGTYECTNALVVTSTGKVGIGNTSPSSSFDLNIGSGGFLVDGSTTTSNIAGKLRVGSTSSSTYDLTVDGHAYLTSGLRVGTTTTPATGGVLANGVIESNTRFIQGSSTSGTGTVMIRTSGGELRPQSSTKFVKDNIVDLNFSKEQVFKLRPVMYNLKPALGGDREIGLIAEEVEEALPELVIYGPERQWIGNTGIPQTDENGKEILNKDKLVPYSVYYDRLPVYLLSIIKEQEARLNQLEKKIADLEAEK